MPAPCKSSNRKTPPELLEVTQTTPFASTVSVAASNPEVIDLMGEANGLASVEVSLTPLTSIWNDDYIEICIVEGNRGWKCKWCGKLFKTRHSTRALWHLLKISGNGISTCKAVIPFEPCAVQAQLGSGLHSQTCCC